jgi:hypothetical protein
MSPFWGHPASIRSLSRRWSCKLSDFLAKYGHKVLPEPNSGCWFWMGIINQGGYGRISLGRRRVVAHRIAYEIDRGPIPAGLQLDHLCRVRCCCNPDHLEPVTASVNVRRAITGSPSFNSQDFDHCRMGHDLTLPGSIYVGPNMKSPRCMECARISRRLWANSPAGRASSLLCNKTYRQRKRGVAA